MEVARQLDKRTEIEIYFSHFYDIKLIMLLKYYFEVLILRL